MDFFSQQVVIGMDVAASEFYDSKDKTYDLNFKEEVINWHWRYTNVFSFPCTHESTSF